jgi:NAD(P)-dependent dehydrogenase (short-subunit alcohol dehydrogenase family)
MSLVIVGAGPNLGLAVARRFGREGFAVGLIARSDSRLVKLTAQLRLDGITSSSAAADIRDGDALANAIQTLAAELGPIEVLEFSPLPAPEFTGCASSRSVPADGTMVAAVRRGGASPSPPVPLRPRGRRGAARPGRG